MQSPLDTLGRPEKIAPASTDAEEAVLGSILINPQSILEVSAFLQSSDFFIVRNGWVWDAIQAVTQRGYAIDNLTVIDELKARGQLEPIGGSSYITYLINNCPTHIHVSTYARMVETAALRRRYLSAAGDIAQIALEDNLEASEITQQVESTVFAVRRKRGSRDGMKTMAQAADEFFDRTEQIQAGTITPGLPTGFADLDKLLGGFNKGELITVAARPGVGKTALLLCFALYMARLGLRVGFFSLEMSIEALMLRLMAMETGIDSQRLKIANRMDSREWGLFTEATGRVSRLPIFLDETPKISPFEFASKARRLQNESGLDVLMVDYMQLMEPDDNSARGNREREVSLISERLKQTARELNVPVLAAAQINREVENRADKRPMLADLRESGAIEQNSDVVMFIYRGVLYEDTSMGPEDAEIIVRKQRQGPTDTVKAIFKANTQQFSNRGPMRKVNLNEIANGNGRGVYERAED